MAKQIDGTEFACLTINADLEAENEKLKKQLALNNNWSKLKEWLRKQADEIEGVPYDSKSLSTDFELWYLNKILDKMQELEVENE